MDIHTSYITTSSSSLHQKLAAGIPLCAGVCQVWDGCTNPNPVKPTPEGSDSETTQQEGNGLAITQHQVRKTSLGWINRKLWFLPWTSAGASTEDGWRFQVMCSGHGHLLGWNGQRDYAHLVEGWTSTCRCHWIVDWMTTMTAHGTRMWLQDNWRMKWMYVLLCQALQYWIIIYCDAEYSSLTPWGTHATDDMVA